MAKLVFDQDGQRYFEAGVQDVVLFVKDGVSLTHHGYAAGVAWNGCTSISESPSGGEANDLWADNMKYASLYSAEVLEGSIEAYTYPDEFCVCDGSAELVTGVYMGQQSRKPFALAYKTKVGNDEDPDMTNYKLHIVYGLMATPSEKSYETINDSPDAITFSWDYTSTPVKTTDALATGKPTSLITIDTTKLTNGVENADLQELLAALYGTDSAEPYLPYPDEVKGFF